jgi:hypothetical protein
MVAAIAIALALLATPELVQNGPSFLSTYDINRTFNSIVGGSANYLIPATTRFREADRGSTGAQLSHHS